MSMRMRMRTADCVHMDSRPKALLVCKYRLSDLGALATIFTNKLYYFGHNQ